MSVQSRRFVFLGGVVLAPYLAALAQDVIIMGASLWRRLKAQAYVNQAEAPTLPGRYAWGLAGAGGLGALALLGIFAAAVHAEYYQPPLLGEKMTVFRRMVGVQDQPVDAMRFFRANHLRGVVLNEWTNGGFVAFHQDPDPGGQPPCKLFMDGRAQAAYTLSQYKEHQYLFSAPNQVNPSYQAELARVARGYNLAADDVAFFDLLSASADEDMRQLGLVFLADPKNYAAVLAHKGITAALLDLSHSANVFQALRKSGAWEIIFAGRESVSPYPDPDRDLGQFVPRYVLLARREAPENRDLLGRLQSDQLTWPEPWMRNLALGFREGISENPQRRQAALEALLALKMEDTPQAVYELIINLGNNRRTEVTRYFAAEREKLKARLESGARANRLGDLRGAIIVNDALGQLARQSSQPDLARACQDELKRYNEEFKNLLGQLREGWLW